MLRQRVITAVIMASLFLVAVVFLPLPALAVAFGVIVCLGAWEWSRLAGWNAKAVRVIYVGLLAAVLGALYVYCQLGNPSVSARDARELVQPILGLACLWWSFALLWVKSYPVSAVLWRTVFMRSVMGFLILAPAWLAAVYLLSYPRGGLLMVVMVIVVASADIGAYFSGKAWGKHKLAVRVSPAKTWEGFWGGLCGCALVSVILWYMLPEQAAHIGLDEALAVTLVTALASVVGDLTVSMVKRESGAKDSGSLLPGHGRVLDRLDSLCGAAPVFALGLLLVGW